MRFTHVLPSALCLATFAFAASHTIEVAINTKGLPDLAFNPPVATAAAGDTVHFQFYAESHTVVQGTDSDPCQPMPGGFYSTLFTTTGSKANKQEFVVTINDTKPIYYYCSYDSHCQLQMVGVINGAMSDYEAFEKAAANADSTVGPTPAGQVVGGVIQPVGAPAPPGSSSSMMMSSSSMMMSSTMSSTMMSSMMPTMMPPPHSNMTMTHGPGSSQTGGMPTGGMPTGGMPTGGMPTGGMSTSSPAPTNTPGAAAGSNSVAGGVIAFAIGLGALGL